MRKRTSYYPVSLSISGKRCLVFGGGQVALRKVKMLLDFGAEVDVVSPELCHELALLVNSGKISVLPRGYQPGDLEGTFIAIAATDDKNINEEISIEGRERGVLVNVVDVPELCDFIVPSYVKRGDLTLAISTGGASPALARKLRTRLEKEFGEEYTALTRIVGEVRAEMRRQGVRVDGDAWQEALDIDSILALLKQGRKQEATATLLDSLKNNVEVGG